MRQNLATALLCELDVAILLRNAPLSYSFYGEPPAFYSSLFPSSDPKEPSAAPWEHSPMMEYFLQEAEDFFTSQTSGRISSGIWQEGSLNDTNYALISTALFVDDAQVLLIRCLADDYMDRTSILQKARENLLEQRKLRGTLQFYQQKSSMDSLTSLYNRATFLDILAVQLTEQAAQGFDLSLLMLDIDDFKQVNDTYGHQAGDTVLRDLGKILHSSLREVDVAGRYGGEEFIVLAPYTSQAQAEILAGKLARNIAGHVFTGLPSVTVSIGYAVCAPGEDADKLIKRADMALYDAKHAGKNSVRFR